MNHKKPEPLSPLPPGRKNCPVCGEISYSKEGIHPQCAQTQADEKRIEKQKKEESKEPAPKPAEKTAGFMKQCPKCKAQMHVRRKSCDCGHTFG